MTNSKNNQDSNTIASASDVQPIHIESCNGVSGGYGYGMNGQAIGASNPGLVQDDPPGWFSPRWWDAMPHPRA
jgi:hypothetical protein